MLKCIAIDDEPRALRVIESHIEKIPFLELSGVFRDGLTALDYLQQNHIDLIFLDINMPDLTGLQFLKSLATQPLVIFTTAYPEYAPESYDFEVVDYLLKPIEFDRFLKAVNRAQREYHLIHPQPTLRTSQKRTDQMHNDTILLKSGTDIHQIKVDHVLYVASAGNYVTFVTNSQEIMTLMTMDDVLEKLPSDRFFRIHRSYIVAAKHITLIERHQVRVNKKSIPIGNLYREGFLKAIQKKDMRSALDI